MCSESSNPESVRTRGIVVYIVDFNNILIVSPHEGYYKTLFNCTISEKCFSFILSERNGITNTISLSVMLEVCLDSELSLYKSSSLNNSLDVSLDFWIFNSLDVSLDFVVLSHNKKRLRL